jgi:hypothetical protein
MDALEARVAELPWPSPSFAELRHCVRSRCSNPALIRLGLIGASGALEASAIPRLKFAVASAITIPKSSVAQHCAKSKV